MKSPTRLYIPYLIFSEAWPISDWRQWGAIGTALRLFFMRAVVYVLPLTASKKTSSFGSIAQPLQFASV